MPSPHQTRRRLIAMAVFNIMRANRITVLFVQSPLSGQSLRDTLNKRAPTALTALVYAAFAVLSWFN